MPGFASNPYSWMSRAAVFVLSSRFEGSPNTLVEAMACGTPVVATDCPSGPAEILANGEFGYLVKIGDHCAIAEGILKGINGEIDPRPAQRRAWDFGVDRVSRSYLDVMLRRG